MIKKEQNRVGIFFDLDNDNPIKGKSKTIKLDYTYNDYSYFVRAEAYSACGDDECPVLYCRCQIRDKYVEGRTSASDKFVYIPGKDKNPNLVDRKNETLAPGVLFAFRNLEGGCGHGDLKVDWSDVVKESVSRLKAHFARGDFNKSGLVYELV